jgi:Holliday junction resolvase RusA-like endonuclease
MKKLIGFAVIVHGKCPPKPRMTGSDAWKDPPRPAVKKYRDYVDKIRAAMIDAKREWGWDDGDSIATRVAVTIDFHDNFTLIDVTEMGGKRGKRAGDLDNMIKTVFEALQDFQNVPILIEDDSQVVSVKARVM